VKNNGAGRNELGNLSLRRSDHTGYWW
jgi:hypothetical protein